MVNKVLWLLMMNTGECKEGGCYRPDACALLLTMNHLFFSVKDDDVASLMCVDDDELVGHE